MGERVIAPAASSAGLAPVGVILAYGGAAAPAGWLLCDGSSYLRTDYAALFAAIGTTFGAADGTHFAVPDGRGRMLIGAGGAIALAATGGALGHTHAIAAPTISWPAGVPTAGAPVISWPAGVPTGTAPVISWPAGVPTQATHTHDAHTSAATGSSGTAKLSGPATHSAIAAAISWPAGVPTGTAPTISWPAGVPTATAPAIAWPAGVPTSSAPAAGTADPPYLGATYIIRSS